MNPAPLDESGVCRLCRAGVTSFDAAHTFGSYERELRELIHLFKFDGIRPLARPLGTLLAQALPRDERLDLIVPAPLHWLRYLERGFNQCHLLAKELSRRTGWPVVGALRRKHAAPHQARLTKAERRRNVSRAFSVPHPEKIQGRRVLLLDDVFTTGATANACASALKQAGAQRVVLLTVARTDRRPIYEWPRVEEFAVPISRSGAM